MSWVRDIWKRSTFWPTVLGALLLLAAFPLPTSWFGWLGPVAANVDTGPRLADSWPGPGPWYISLALLGWLAGVPWVWLIRRERLPGRRPYLVLWTVGFAYWLIQLHWLTLPYWATSLGWLALSWYLAFYLPVFVGLCRTAVHRLGLSVIVAAPVIWTGLELARGHLLTGFTMASLGHTQYRWLALIQVSDLAGAYGVSFVVMFVSACLARVLPMTAKPPSREQKPDQGSAESAGWTIWPIVPIAVLLAAVLLYGHWRLAPETENLRTDTSSEGGTPTQSVADSSPDGVHPEVRAPLRMALIQGSIDTQIKDDPQKQIVIMEQYIWLSQEAVRKFGPLDILVWPETMFRIPLVTFEEPMGIPEEWTGKPEEFHRSVRESVEWGRRQIAELARSLGVHLLLGIDGQHVGPEGIQFFNTAVFVDPQGNILERYDKMHPVLFGEYVPLAKRVRFLQKLTPLGPGLTEGRRAVAVPLGQPPLQLSPTICYESVLPHVVRRPILMLRAEGTEPDVMVNLTNDGWFYGSIELDLHLICGVFRAVECRKPWVIAANTGFSAWIDGDGRIRKIGPRRATGVVLAEVSADPRGSLYLDYGDWFAGLCLVAAGLVGVLGLVPSRFFRPKFSTPSSPAGSDSRN